MFSTGGVLVFRSGSKHVHDPVEVLNTSEFDANAAFADSKGNLHIGIQPIGEG